MSEQFVAFVTDSQSTAANLGFGSRALNTLTVEKQKWLTLQVSEYWQEVDRGQESF